MVHVMIYAEEDKMNNVYTDDWWCSITFRMVYSPQIDQRHLLHHELVGITEDKLDLCRCLDHIRTGNRRRRHNWYSKYNSLRTYCCYSVSVYERFCNRIKHIPCRPTCVIKVYTLLNLKTKPVCHVFNHIDLIPWVLTCQMSITMWKMCRLGINCRARHQSRNLLDWLRTEDTLYGLHFLAETQWDCTGGW